MTSVALAAVGLIMWPVAYSITQHRSDGDLAYSITQQRSDEDLASPLPEPSALLPDRGSSSSRSWGRMLMWTTLGFSVLN